ncbi:hypothetical protein BDN72DRAFT_830136 [Pluteus cervinus]|uniref:Uncharacterized protein n=1 Tax=Pluteus cervinus TaxID=181527 RepID=A0ACD3BFH6_9AGAR|nr:hypothetical protein BDN72DRAFT_830136 [Pluteus cervinus]
MPVMRSWMPIRLVMPHLLLSFLISYCGLVSAQKTVNGQEFTNGLSIINSPSSGTPFTSGGTLPISIDVSGDGALPQAAVAPGSGLETHYEGLNIFLVSAQTNINVTVSSGTQLLTGESGTVRHLNFQIPTCIPAGPYNLTFYEQAQINGTPSFAITPIPITIQNNHPSGDCSSISNTLQPQPQPCSPYGQSPFLPGGSVVVGITETFTIATVLLSMVTVTTTLPGANSPLTTTFASTQTTETFVRGTGDNSGFVPVNTSHRASASFFPWFWNVFALARLMIL